MAKKKHVIRDSMKSFFDYHTDPVKHEQLQATRKDMEEKKNEILNIVHNEGDKEELKSGSLAELIEGFHKQYESLYAHYDHLTGELKDKVHKHHHENKDSSSSSESDSDSDSDHSPKEKGIRNTTLEDEISKTTDGLRQELEATKLEVTLFKNQLEIVCDEKKTLESAYDAIVSNLMSTEKIVEELNLGTDALNSEKSNLLAVNEDLNSKLEDFLKTEVDLKQQIEELIRDKHNLDIENSSLKLELDTVTREKKEMEEQFESKVIELEKTVEEVPGLKTKISQVEILLKERDDQLSSLQNKLEVNENESNSKIEALTAQVDDSTQVADELPAEKTQLEEQLEGHLQEGRLDFEQAQSQIKKLKREMEKARKEADVALEKTRIMEVQLRLANQKIHVTEQVLAEKEEDYKNSKNFQEECKLLEYKISRLLLALAANDKAYGGMITNITENVNSSIAGMEYFTKKFEEDNSKFSSRIYDISEEIRIMKQFLAGKNTKREKLEEQLRNLTEELQKEREYGLTVKENLSKLKAEVEKEQVEKEKVLAALNEVKGSREELDALLTKKNEQVMILEDEKREAIRQLCLWSGNLQSRYDEVKNMVVKSRAQKR